MLGNDLEYGVPGCPGTQKYYANPKQRHTFSAVNDEDLWGISPQTSTEPDLQRQAKAEAKSDGTGKMRPNQTERVRGEPGSEHFIVHERPVLLALLRNMGLSLSMSL